jgi:hypothetical protein
MANQAVVVKGTSVTVSTSASTLVAAAMDSETKASLAQTYPIADLTLATAFGSAPTVMGNIDVYRHDLNVDGANDTPTPIATYTQVYIGSFTVSATASTQYLLLSGVPVSADCTFYLENNTDQTMSIGWVLKAIPWTYGPAA